MLSFGDTALIVLDPDKFIRRVKAAAEKLVIKFILSRFNIMINY